MFKTSDSRSKRHNKWVMNLILSTCTNRFKFFIVNFFSHSWSWQWVCNIQKIYIIMSIVCSLRKHIVIFVSKIPLPRNGTILSNIVHVIERREHVGESAITINSQLLLKVFPSWLPQMMIFKLSHDCQTISLHALHNRTFTCSAIFIRDIFRQTIKKYS